MDEFDRAQEIEERDRALCVFAALHPPKTDHIEPVGRCHNCGEELPPGALFCDAECRADYEKRQRMKRITGKG